MPQLTADVFLQTLKKDLSGFSQKRFLIAVSGGPDSMVLAHLAQQAGLKYSLIHVNYNLRGEASRMDAQLVSAFAETSDVQCYRKDILPEEKETVRNIQTWAREVRYDFFRHIYQQEGYDFLLTAHHLDDNLETFLINLSRGSGLKGLTGIPRLTDWLYRPLLEFSRTDILNYAEENSIKFRMDDSNEKDDYLRNRIRHHIASAVKTIGPDFPNHFAQSLRYLTQAQELVAETISEKQHLLVQKNEEVIVIHLPKFLQQNPLVQFEILRQYGFDNETENAKIKTAQTGSVFTSANWEMLKTTEALHFRKKEDKKSESPVILEPKEESRSYQLQDYLPDLPKHNQCWRFDAAALHLPLLLQKSQPGDVFQPRGLKGTKKVGKFLRDEKIIAFEREKIWLLTDSRNQILGVVPLRQDGRFANEQGEIEVLF